MNENNEFNQFLPDESVDPAKLSVEVPAEQPIAPERIPTSFDPMGEIHLRGQAYRGLAGGRTPWWILISGWFVFGSIVAMLLHAAIAATSLTLWIFVIIAIIPLFILGRGTLAKLADRGYQN